MSGLFRRVTRVVRNALLDWQYGPFLGGNVATRFGTSGAHDVVNSDYETLGRVFEGRVRPADVLCDVGCGKGRVINFWLSRGYRNPMLGIELDPDIARATQKRLAGHRNVQIIAGDAASKLPAAPTLFYLYNPFSRRVLRSFVSAVAARGTPARIFYYHAMFVDVFDGFEVETVELGEGTKPLLIASLSC